MEWLGLTTWVPRFKCGGPFHVKITMNINNTWSDGIWNIWNNKNNLRTWTTFIQMFDLLHLDQSGLILHHSTFEVFQAVLLKDRTKRSVSWTQVIHDKSNVDTGSHFRTAHCTQTRNDSTSRWMYLCTMSFMWTVRLWSGCWWASHVWLSHYTQAGTNSWSLFCSPEPQSEPKLSCTIAAIRTFDPVDGYSLLALTYMNGHCS